ncbi:MAG: hypothetical protein IPM31_14915 [Anaerolineae bacterium]|nr:hypothetical protein [Anaerolineae bacterium]MBL8106970.1 hypothetical protein [Anaerolineales bacterium]MCC7188071.1 hypothetical protein [Anaerolineales bacterium]
MEQQLTQTQINERISLLEEQIRRLQSELAVLRSQKLVNALLDTDGPLPRENQTITRTAAGLTIKDSRLTLYALMDEIREGNSLKNVRDLYELTDEEMLDILDYIHLHKEEVEKEYRSVLKAADENRKYWEEKNQEQLEKLYVQRDAVLLKLQEWREQYHADRKP